MRYCEVCNEEIPQERLECVPETHLCIVHAREAEKYGGEFSMVGTQDNIAKSGSLKKNYGSMTVHKRRNRRALERLKDDGFQGRSTSD